jgi:prepilin-type N-terminal cleavage/methylation domain-containing protein
MRSVRLKSRSQSGICGRLAFTLVEMLVVIAIMLALTTITIVSVNFSIYGDRVRAGARQIQSAIAGARDRAIYAKNIRGIRLIRDPNDNHCVSAIQYIGAPSKVSIGTLTLNADLSASPTFPPATPNDGTYLDGTTNLFQTLKNQGLVKAGSRIQIPKETGRWYTIASIFAGPAGNDRIVLAQKYSNFIDPTKAGSNYQRTYNNLSYQLELQPQPLPDSPPVQLPRGVVIDLDGSQVPATWRPSSFGGAYSNQMDILFSAKGLPVGDVVTLGMVHLHIADAGDVIKWQQLAGRSTLSYALSNLPLVPAEDPTIVTRDRILITLATRTGNASVHQVNVTNVDGFPNFADDPFYFAETGGVASK